MKFLTLLIFSLFIGNISSALADIPQSITQFSLQNLRTIADNTLKVSVIVRDKESLAPHMWDMTPEDIAILYKKIENLPRQKEILTKLNIKDPPSAYKGLLITITNKYGETLEPFIVYKGALLNLSREIIALDPNRNLEYAIWGMNYTYKNRNLEWQMLPIISFKDCIKLGNRLVETLPRQCLLTNGDIFLDVDENPTKEALSIKDFEGCLTLGQAIINTFPRRCIAAGGHVYTEAPKIR